MIHNFTIDHQLNHRSIRKFKDQPLSADQLTHAFRGCSSDLDQPVFTAGHDHSGN